MTNCDAIGFFCINTSDCTPTSTYTRCCTNHTEQHRVTLLNECTVIPTKRFCLHKSIMQIPGCFVFCSPSQGPCCEESCVHVPESANSSCKGMDDCNMPAYCNGMSPHCPEPEHTSNGTFCNENTQVCLGGVGTTGIEL